MSNDLTSKPEGQSNRYRVWLNQAMYDLEAARNSHRTADFEWACYQSIQSVEKAIKGVIVYSGFRPPKTHKLGVLLSIANRANKSFENVKLKFRKIESYTFISRYPFVLPDEDKTPHELIGKDDAETCIQLANDIYTQVVKFVESNPGVGFKDISTIDYYFTANEIQERIEEIKSKISASEKMEVQKIILFGSFAREKTRPRTSTMDILVIADTQLNFIERIQHVRTITKGTEPIIEPLIYTPQEFSFMLDEKSEGFLESAIEEGRVIYERNS